MVIIFSQAYNSSILLRMDTLCIWVHDWNIRYFLFNLQHYLFNKKVPVTMSETTPGFEHSQLKGITIKNMIVTVVCTASLVITIMGAYNGLKESMTEQRLRQDTQNQLIDLRLKAVEDQQTIIRQQIKEIQDRK